MHEPLIQLSRGVLESLYTAHAGSLAAYASTLTSSAEEAEDLVHEVFVSLLGASAWANMPLAYLMRAIRNKAIDQGRRSTTRCRAERSVSCQVPRVEAQATSGESSATHVAICDALAALAPHAAEIVTLRTRCGLSFPEVARVLDEPLGTVSARYVRAIATIRASLLAGVPHE